MDASQSAIPRQLKRNRIPLSCFPCRASKQKCDRARPCVQCQRKGLPEKCRYAPRPEKKGAGGRPAKGMAARLEKLEGMVRSMAEAQARSGPVTGTSASSASSPSPETAAATTTAAVTTPAGKERVASVTASSSLDADAEVVDGSGGRLVHGERSSNFVGATHIMAILEDIEEMRSYFDDPEEPEGDSPPSMEAFESSSEMLLFSAGTFRTKEDLIQLLPDRSFIDRIIRRYFDMFSPSRYLVHRPKFERDYRQFWDDPARAPINFIALLFMLLSIGVYFTSFAAPDELLAANIHDSMQQTKLYRSAAGWALVYGKYMSPGLTTMPPLVLFVESEFMFNRANQSNCYVLVSVVIRVMLKMGLHREPSTLSSISPYESEMRRRLWTFAVILDIIVSFHVGLPNMTDNIESDTQMPRNLLDDDFDEETTELPPARPPTQYTIMTYPVLKCHLAKVFSKIAASLHRLTPVPYSTVMQLDGELAAAWAQRVPHMMMLRPLEELSTTNPPHQAIQRYGLSCLYHKSRCVLHRRFLTEPSLHREHDYSRRVCIESATTLLDHQDDVYQAMQPGKLLHSITSFVSALTVYDFVLAATVLYALLKHPQYEQMCQLEGWPERDKLIKLLQRSQFIWMNLSRDVKEARKTADIIGTMLRTLGASGATPSLPVDMSSSVDCSMLPIEALSMSDQMGVGSQFIDPAIAVPSVGQAPYLNLPLPGVVDTLWDQIDTELDWKTFEPMFLQVQADANEEQELSGGGLGSWLGKSHVPMDSMECTDDTWAGIN